jgi:hypothetical protein
MGRVKKQSWWWSNESNTLPILLNGNGWGLTKQFNTREPVPARRRGILSRMFNKKINYIEKIFELKNNKSKYHNYYESNRSANNETKAGLIKNIIFEFTMVLTLIADKKSGFTKNNAAPFLNKLKLNTGVRTAELYKIHEALKNMTVKELKELKATVPSMV